MALIRTSIAGVTLALSTVLGTIAGTGPLDPADAVAPRAAPTCEGEAATLVGSPGGVVRGTDDRDVVVTRGASRVLAGAADDLVCVTGRAAEVEVRGDDGNDRVVVLAATVSEVSLGAGNDTFAGGSGRDVVDREGSPGADQVSTGAGPDLVHTGESGVANRDVVDLGAGRDEVVYHGVDNATAVVDGGPGLDRVSASYGTGPTPETDMVVDNAVEDSVDASSGRALLDGRTAARWVGLERFDVATFTTGGVEFRGGSAAEQVWATGGNPIAVDLGAGDDLLRIDDVSVVQSISGGEGRDRLAVWAGAEPLAGSLVEQRIAFAVTLDAAEQDQVVGFDAVESLDLVAETVRVTGTDGPDLLRVGGCDVVAAGTGGRDRLVRLPAVHLDGDCGRRTSTRLVGGRGADELVGGAGDDVLLGGAARDLALGRAGTDRCRAETTRSCETG